MSLTKMSPKGWRYYAQEIAQGREDYWAENLSRGEWLGRGAQAMGTAGRDVEAMALERVFGHGAHPTTGESLGRGFSPDDDRAVAGYALTFSPPKSVSALWAVADETIAARMAAAHDAAVRAGLAYLEDHAAFTRRGKAGLMQVDTDGLLAAAFVHRTSRAASCWATIRRPSASTCSRRRDQRSVNSRGTPRISAMPLASTSVQSTPSLWVSSARRAAL